MKKIILIGAFALLAACGGSDKDVAVGDATDDTSADDTSSEATDDSTSEADSTEISVEGSDDTIIGRRLRRHATEVHRTAGDVPQADRADGLRDRLGHGDPRENSRTFSEAVPGGVRLVRYRDRSGWMRQVQPHRIGREAVRADGRVGGGRGAGRTRVHQRSSVRWRKVRQQHAGSLPSDCAGTIAQIEPYLAKGTMQDLTVAEVGLGRHS